MRYSKVKNYSRLKRQSRKKSRKQTRRQSRRQTRKQSRKQTRRQSRKQSRRQSRKQSRKQRRKQNRQKGGGGENVGNNASTPVTDGNDASATVAANDNTLTDGNGASTSVDSVAVIESTDQETEASNQEITPSNEATIPENTLSTPEAEESNTKEAILITPNFKDDTKLKKNLQNLQKKEGNKNVKYVLGVDSGTNIDNLTSGIEPQNIEGNNGNKYDVYKVPINDDNLEGLKRLDKQFKKYNIDNFTKNKEELKPRQPTVVATEIISNSESVLDESNSAPVLNENKTEDFYI